MVSSSAWKQRTHVLMLGSRVIKGVLLVHQLDAAILQRLVDRSKQLAVWDCHVGMRCRMLKRLRPSNLRSTKGAQECPSWASIADQGCPAMG